MAKFMYFLGVLAAAIATPAVADSVDNFSTQAISLEQVVRVSPRDGGAYAELAGAYVRAGRVADAMSAYRQVLALDNVMLETRSGDAVWSHEVARQALANETVMTSL
jgi:predicted TPR repeat methyltransferase